MNFEQFVEFMDNQDTGSGHHGRVDSDRGVTCNSCGWISGRCMGDEGLTAEDVIAEWDAHRERVDLELRMRF